MLPRPFAVARPLSQLLRAQRHGAHRHTPTITQIRHITQADIDDPDMVSIYIHPNEPQIPFSSTLPTLISPSTNPSTNKPPLFPHQNGGYIQPPPQKRQFRDPYGDWWDKQERRHFGEPVHEDHDILGMMSLHEYTHFTPRRAFFLLGCFVTSFFGLAGVVRLYYPDRPSVPRTFEGGLERELGGRGHRVMRDRD
ncbi:MAG: hypothetical protein L6R41_007384 [Letrouitia leprolyta]|nr:MAG: hypothetical protein L6R41_007384 [Letrouitia leprolyta]